MKDTTQTDELPDDFGELPFSDKELAEVEPFFPPDWTPDNPKYHLPANLGDDDS